MQETHQLIAIGDRFTHSGTITDVQAFGSGNINDTFLVTLESSTERQFVLQRINTQVFRQPELVMQNMQIFSEHVRNRLQSTPLDRRWEVPHVLLTKDDRNYVRDADGSFWRAISLIENSESFDILEDAERAREVGYALGMFHTLISDLPPKKLADTLEGFHITPNYLQQYEAVVGKAIEPNTAEGSSDVRYCLQFVNDRAAWSNILEVAKAEGRLPLRLMHGDPKINNVLFDTTTGKAVSVIDLDTVKPGLIHYDIGDCLRSGCNPVGEETQDWDSIRFDLDLCRGILQGYFSAAKAFLTEQDYAYIYDSIRLITFELGLRFFTDYLAGSVYFKVKYPEHNLNRAIVQFKLTESIESQEASIRSIVEEMNHQ
jgi:Ser/Thr protein kinase RdoA (MazF antagonist)